MVVYQKHIVVVLLVTSSTVTSYFTVPADEGCEDENFVLPIYQPLHPNNVTKWCFDIDPSTGLPNPGSSGLQQLNLQPLSI